MTDKSKNSNPPASVFRIRHLFYFLGAVLLMLAVFSFQAVDYAILAKGVEGAVVNWIGNLGAVVAGALFYFIGLSTYMLAVTVMLAAVRPFLPQNVARQWFIPGLVLSVFGLALLLALDPAAFAESCDRLGIGRLEVPALALSGGVIGQALAAPGFENIPPGVLRSFLGAVGCSITGTIILLSGLVMLYRSEWHDLVKSFMLVEPAERPAKSKARESFAERTRKLMEKFTPAPSEKVETPEVSGGEAAAPAAMPAPAPAPEPAPMPEPAPTPAPAPAPAPAVSAAPVPAAAASNTAPVPDVPAYSTDLAPVRITEEGKNAPRVTCADYVLPPITMLGKGEEIAGESLEVIARTKELLQNTLDSFKIDGQVVGHVSGPRVTRYEIRLAPSVKVNKVTEIERNIAMNLKASSLRILAPIPGMDLIGVEVPNTRSEAIFMRSVMESDAWRSSKYEIPIVLGKDISGNPVVLDLAKAPHLLIAGATGSGKSVCMNCLIMSLLMKFRPDELKLIMVDPKVVEFAPYRPLPHLITPVIDEPKKVPIALRWAATEMDKRYKLLAKACVRKLKDYNNRRLPEVPVLDDDGLPLPDKLPILIVIIDELADLMMTDARSDIETSINRIAAKGRAAGVHIVVATQSPRRDVITGTIKSNLPTRIAFRVVSLVDSRVILDQKGAEQLLGMGDMLMLSPNLGGALERIQGALVTDDDAVKVVEFVSAQAPQYFDSQVVTEESEEDDDDVPARGGSGDWSDEDADAFIDSGFELDPMVQKYMQPGDDDLVRRALEVVLLEKKASTSYIQRRLKIGYNRAAELIDLFEERGIVGPPSGSGAKRDILVFDDIINE